LIQYISNTAYTESISKFVFINFQTLTSLACLFICSWYLTNFKIDRFFSRCASEHGFQEFRFTHKRSYIIITCAHSGWMLL